MKRHVIIGTAGHIDHGKTALIKALTNIETDVLKEEKERGITIELGFAYWKDNITIIDVPGHERFVKTMVAGVSTIDLFLLVIAADDGIMPQTIEHLDILKFFGVKNGLAALNKIDLIDEEWQELMMLEIEDFLKKNGYHHIPIVPVSAVSGEGIDRLRQLVVQKIEQCAERLSTRPFRLNVDRSFSIHGAGTVVTGTVLSDEISVDDMVQILPTGQLSKVRGLQVHQKDVRQAVTGQRVAINLSNVSKNEVERGKTLVRPDSLEAVQEFLAILQTSTQIPVKIKKHQEVRVYLGTAEHLGRITWFEEKSNLEPSQTYHVRIRLEEAGVCAPGDPVLIRSTSPFYTIAGGRVLFLNPPHLSLLRPNWPRIFERLTTSDLKESIKIFFQFKGFTSIALHQLVKQFFEKEQVLNKELALLTKEGNLIKIEHKNEPYFIYLASLEDAQNRLLQTIEKTQNPNGFNKAELKALLRPRCKDDLFFDRLLQRMINRNLLIPFSDRFLTATMAKLEKQYERQQQILKLLQERGFQALKISEIAQMLNLSSDELKPLLSQLVKQGKIHSLAGVYYLHETTFEKILTFLSHQFKKQKQLDIASFKEFTGLTRKLLIPLLEYLDQKQYTQRNGDVRVKGPLLH